MLKKAIKFLYYSYLTKVFKGKLIIGRGSKLAFNKFQFKDDCTVKIGEQSIIESNIYFDKPGGHIIIGNRTFIGGSKLVCADKIEIGDDVLISWDCTIVDHDSHSLLFSERKNDVLNGLNGLKEWNNVSIGPVKINDKCWIGFGVRILKGVTVGEGACIAAGSLVTKDVAPYTLVGGVPAKMIKILPKE
ncbi:MAG: acyltransferase [Bacteroidota bacterium]|nr:acyltransferase [Bacteroidota bacterium]